jgi:hypothetical protein
MGTMQMEAEGGASGLFIACEFLLRPPGDGWHLLAVRFTFPGVVVAVVSHLSPYFGFVNLSLVNYLLVSDC